MIAKKVKKPVTPVSKGKTTKTASTTAGGVSASIDDMICLTGPHPPVPPISLVLNSVKFELPAGTILKAKSPNKDIKLTKKLTGTVKGVTLKAAK